MTRKVLILNLNCSSNLFVYKNLTFLDQRFIAFIVVMYSSFARYEEMRELKINDVYLIGHDFSVTFFKGKSYQVGGQRHGVVPALPSRLYDPARIFSIYLDSISKIHPCQMLLRTFYFQM